MTDPNKGALDLDDLDRDLSDVGIVLLELPRLRSLYVPLDHFSPRKD